ncbi:MAG: HD domain-containing protein [Thermodesulfobacteriota bacterium]
MQCPGQDSRFWKADAIYEARCPKCNQDVEFFKDDTARKCPYCGHRFVNPELDFGCAAYCQFAEQCLGSLPEEVKERQQDMLKDKVGMEMRRHFKTDARRIRHATTVAGYAERIGKEEGGNLGVIIMAAYLHDIHAAGSRQGSRVEDNSPAGQILEKAGASEEVIREVLDILDHLHQPGEEAGLSLRAVYEADLISTLEEEQAEEPRDTEKISRIIEENILTRGGRKLAQEVLLRE